MKTQHTPGPWQLMPGTCCIRAKDVYAPKIATHMMVASVNGEECSDAPAPDGEMTIATARGWGRLVYLGEEKAIAIQDANARLIAAAPELLEACEKVLELFDTGPTTATEVTARIGRVYSVLRAAIAKAKGNE